MTLMLYSSRASQVALSLIQDAFLPKCQQAHGMMRFTGNVTEPFSTQDDLVQIAMEASGPEVEFSLASSSTSIY